MTHMRIDETPNAMDTVQIVILVEQKLHSLSIRPIPLTDDESDKRGYMYTVKNDENISWKKEKFHQTTV